MLTNFKKLKENKYIIISNLESIKAGNNEIKSIKEMKKNPIIMHMVTSTIKPTEIKVKDLLRYVVPIDNLTEGQKYNLILTILRNEELKATNRKLMYISGIKETFLTETKDIDKLKALLNIYFKRIFDKNLPDLPVNKNKDTDELIINSMNAHLKEYQENSSYWVEKGFAIVSVLTEEMRRKMNKKEENKESAGSFVRQEFAYQI